MNRSFSHDMPRTHRSTLQGKHYGRVCGRTNSALLSQKLLTVTLLTCYVDADVFKAWVTQELPPKIPKISIIVMDNAAFPKRIEHTWAQCQRLQRSLNCSIHALFNRYEL